jgi:hypothetical protein
MATFRAQVCNIQLACEDEKGGENGTIFTANVLSRYSEDFKRTLNTAHV